MSNQESLEMIKCTRCSAEVEKWYLDNGESKEEALCEPCYDIQMDAECDAMADAYFGTRSSCRCGGAGACIECNPNMFI